MIATSSSYAWASGVGDGGARCSLTTGSAVDFDFLQYVNIPAAAVAESDVMAGTRAFPVTKGNLFTVNLVCDEFAGDMTLSDSSITAIFAPS